MCFGCGDADPILSGMEHFPLLSVSAVGVHSANCLGAKPEIKQIKHQCDIEIIEAVKDL